MQIKAFAKMISTNGILKEDNEKRRGEAARTFAIALKNGR